MKQKLFRRLTSTLCALVLLLALLPGTALAADASGSFGANITWSFSGGTLSIQGTGPMDSDGSGDMPWKDFDLRTVIIGDGVTSIAAGAFSSCINLSSVTIPDSVTGMGASAFSNCRSLTAITLPNNIASIPYGAFMVCTGLTSVTIPDGVARIDSYAFAGCENLKTVTIPASVAIMGDGAFNAPGLTDVYYSGSESQWKQITISNQYNDPLLSANIHYSPTASDTTAPGSAAAPAASDMPATPSMPAAPASPGTSSAASPAIPAEKSQPAATINFKHNNYSYYYKTPLRSYLFENSTGGLTRVEFYDEKIIVEDYDNSFQYQCSRTIPKELDIWGGFFAGDTCNFFIFGQRNPEENDSQEVVRIVKYSKDWQRLGHASLYGANTVTPFDAGTLRCAEGNGYLYIRTCHLMYKSSDGKNHQSSMMLTMRESDMTFTEQLANPGKVDYRTGYVSHSFNQFILIDSKNRAVALDHGDGYPRAAVVQRFTAAGRDSANLVTFPGSVGNNTTGCTVGGLAETSNGYVAVYNDNGKASLGGATTVYLSFISEDLRVKNTALTGNEGTQTPVLAPTGLNGGYVMWQKTSDNTFCYAQYDANGNAGAVQTAKGALSDCQPIYWNGKAVWYVTSSSAPVFYTLDASGITATPVSSASQPGSASQPASPAAQGVGAVLSPQKLEVDGKNVDCEKYNIDGSNYFKLRDLAYVLNGTGSQFAVGFDAAASTVTITTGAAYTSNGTELVTGKDNSKTAQSSRQTILIDGVERGDLTAYNIGGSNFFKLRELGDALGFEVDFNTASNAAVVRSK